MRTTEVIEVTQEITNTGIIPLEALRAHLSKRPHKSIAKMPAPKNPKEVKQFLGLVIYYRKFIPRFADIS